MKVCFRAEAEAGNESVNVTLTIYGKATSFRLPSLDSKVSRFLWCSTKVNGLISEDKEVWSFYISRQSKLSAVDALSKYAALIIEENNRLFEMYKAIDITVEKEG